MTWVMVENTKMKAWGFWNWDVREICFGDEAADGSTSFKATKQITHP